VSSTTVVLDGLGAVRAAEGRHLGGSAWLEVGAESVNRFLASTGAEPHEPSTSVPADLLLALTNRFLPTIVEVRGVSMGVNYGVDALRFGPAVPVGSRIRASAALVEVIDVAGGVQTRMRLTVEAEARSEPVCVLDALSRYYT
jgi:hypothetical protein